MLVLTRKQGEKIIIGHDVEVAILGYDEKLGVKIGIQAPKSIPVHREEIFKRLKKEGKTHVND